MNLNLQFRRNVKDNLIGSFFGNLFGWLAYEYTKRVIDDKTLTKHYEINKHKRI
jgi:hypothetical protein